MPPTTSLPAHTPAHKSARQSGDVARPGPNLARRRGLRHPRWLEIALLLLAWGLRAWKLGAPSLWYDEAFLWWATSQVPLRQSLVLSLREIIPPFTYLGWRAWIPLAGDSEFALRAPSALMGVLAVAAGGRLMRRLTGHRAGARAALALLALATPLLWASREMRMYGPLMALVLLSGMALVETLLGPEDQRHRWAWLWGASTLAALYSLVLTGFWLLGQGLFALVFLLRQPQERRQALWRALLPPALACAALYLPWILAVARRLGENAGYWAGYLPLRAFFQTAFEGMTTSMFAPESVRPALSSLLIGLCALSLLATRRRPWAGLYALSWALPLALLGVLFRTLPKWEPRHAVIFAPAPGLALAAAWGAAQTRPRRTSTRRPLSLLCLGMAVTLLAADLNLLAHPDHADWRGAVAYVQAHRRPGDAVILETGSIFPAWRYYAREENHPLCLPADDLLDVRNVLHYGNTAPLLNQQLSGAEGVWLVTWIAEVTDPTAIVPALLGDLGHEKAVPAFHDLGLRHFVLERRSNFPPEPPTSARPNAELLPGLQLWGYQLRPPPIEGSPAPQMATHEPDGLPATAIRADEPLAVRTWWTTAAPQAHAGRFYQASLRLYDAAGSQWGQIDEPPGGGDYRPERWPPNTPILGQFSLTPPPGTPAGLYTATLTLYEGNTTGEIALGTVALRPPSVPPEIPASMTPASATNVATDTPLRLLAASVHRTEIKPCETLHGKLFWEVAAPLTETLRVRVTLGTQENTVPPTAHFAPEAWQPGMRFATHFALPIACRAPDTEAALAIDLLPAPATEATTAATTTGIPQASWYGPKARIAGGRSLEAPPDIVAQRAAFALGDAPQETVALIGYRLEPPHPRASEPFTVTLYWQPAGITDAAYTVFVHATPPEARGPIAAQHDAWPAQAQRPTYTWIPGEVIADAHPLPGLPAGTHALRVGLYDAEGTRLRLLAPGDPDDAVALDPLVTIR